MKLKIFEEEIKWTRHSRKKMRYYCLSENKVKGILRDPDRKEVGIAPGTIAAMQISGTKKNPKEIWAMYQRIIVRKKRIIKIISSWRYPGRSPKGQMPEIPEDTLWELERLRRKDQNDRDTRAI
jgi:hypothetical protein